MLPESSAPEQAAPVPASSRALPKEGAVVVPAAPGSAVVPSPPQAATPASSGASPSSLPKAAAPASDGVPPKGVGTAPAAPGSAVVPSVPKAAAPPAGATGAPPVGATGAGSVPGGGSRGASTWANPDSVAKRLESVGMLLTNSSGVKQIEEKGNSEAKAKLSEARDLHQQAEGAIKAGDTATANELLGKATHVMFQGVRLADSEGVNREKIRGDFDRRVESVKALRDAQLRISKEKNLETQGKETDRQVELMVQKAGDLLKQGKNREGRAELDNAYVSLKLSIEKMRRGEQLVRSLHFASKAEEYEYEMDRNKTHEMLVNMLLKEKGSDPMVQNFVGKAKEIRLQSEALAAKGEHEKAVAVMEQSTAELIKAIRSAGIFIPG